MSNKKIAIWFGYKTRVNFNNEGIARAIYYMVESLARNYAMSFEFWCYEINRHEIQTYYIDKLLSHGVKGIEIKTECFQSLFQMFLYNLRSIQRIEGVSWKETSKSFLNYNKNTKGIKKVYVYILCSFLLYKGIYCKLLSKFYCIDVSSFPIENDFLVKIANVQSGADCFIIPIVNLDNALQLNKTKIIMLYDLVTLEFYDLCIKNDPECVEWIERGVNCANAFVDNNSYFFTISQYVIDKQYVRFLKNANKDKASCIYLANMVSDNVKNELLSFDELKAKYKLKKPYIYFPSQIRPHKNFITLLKALKKLIDQGDKIFLVITGVPEHNKEVYNYIKKNKLSDMIIQVNNIPEIDLYSLYKYAAAMVSPSLFEGGFPLQALEAFSFETPVILADIPVTIERLNFAGFDHKNHNLEIFNSENASQLAAIIKNVIQNRNKYVKKQKIARDKLLSYSWDDASKHYYESIMRVLNKQL